MKDGAVTCNALFVDMKPLQPPYYVLATYPYEVYGSRKTIIDNTGRDVNACLFGGVKQDGDFFMATDRDGKTMWYDGQGGRDAQLQVYPQRSVAGQQIFDIQECVAAQQPVWKYLSCVGL